LVKTSSPLEKPCLKPSFPNCCLNLSLLSQLVLNGHTLKSGEFKHKWIGNLSLKQRRGHNTLTVRYQKSHVTALGSGLTGAVWVIVVAVVCAMRIPLIKEM